MNIALCVCVCMYMYVSVTSVPSESPVCPSSGEAGHAGRTVSVTLDVLEASRSTAALCAPPCVLFSHGSF